MTPTDTLDWRRTKSSQLRGLERRESSAAALQLRDAGADTWTLSGFASVTDVDYDIGFATERIASGAFRRTLSEHPDLQLLVNHGGLPLARTLSGTLRLEERATPDGAGRRGLWIEADLDKQDPDAQSLQRKMMRGDIDQMSMAFQVTQQKWNEDYTRRVITALSLNRGDVSVVNQAANPAAMATIRAAQLGTRPPLPDFTADASDALAVIRARHRESDRERERWTRGAA
jgi:HK97 family phage prohead protease